uniref:Uncharacterized protein n=1 Tax=Haemonchus contortus TaxID=6289 RepID=W6NCY3_HAECO
MASENNMNNAADAGANSMQTNVSHIRVCLASFPEMGKEDDLGPERGRKVETDDSGSIEKTDIADWSALRTRSGLSTEESPGQSNCGGSFEAEHVATESIFKGGNDAAAPDITDY